MTQPFVLAKDPPGPAHVLIAEDDAAAASVLSTLLTRVGYQVEIAVDGAKTLERLEQGPVPDVLILDWMLPRVSGLEICQWVRERWDALELPILMVTAKADAESISAAFDAGASDYLPKPFLGAELRARVASHLHVKHLLEERRQMDEYLMEREKLSTLGLLVSGVAHDLNNPLAGISGYAQILLEEENNAENIAALQRILGEVRRCNRIVSDLLAFARRQPSERLEVDLRSLLRSTLELRERYIQSGGIELDVKIPEELPRVWADPYQLQQVFLNILINAEHALRSSGSRVGVAVRSVACDQEAQGDSAWLVVEFSNDGPPIPARILPHIFDPFFTTKNKDEGTGLGLAICQRIVTEHGGSIDVWSGEEGTRFEIRLPAHPVHEPVRLAI